MPAALDTPARAAKSNRPKTRAWKRLISEADRDSENASKIRAELRKHLDAADRLAQRRAKRVDVNQSQIHSSDVLQTAAQHDARFDILMTRDVNWRLRISTMQLFQQNPTNIPQVAPALAFQLVDLRSQIVCAAAAAIEAAKNLYAPVEARTIFDAALANIAVTKKVMADARQSAAMHAVSAQTDRELWSHIVSCASTCTHEKGRKLAVDAVARFLVSSSCEQRKQLFIDTLSSTAVDKSPIVRKAAHQLVDALKRHATDEEVEQIFDSLSEEAKNRLLSNQPQPSASAPAAAGQERSNLPSQKQWPQGAQSARPAGKLSMKEMIRKRREEMKKQKLVEQASACADQVETPMVVDSANSVDPRDTSSADVSQDIGKRHDIDRRSSGRRGEGRKRRALISKEKENLPQASA